MGTPDRGSSAAPLVAIGLRPLASSLPLGFFSFGMGMLLLAALDDGWVAAAQSRQIGLMLVAFVFPLEGLSAIIGFLARDAFAATGFGLFSTSWLTLGMTLLTGTAGSTSAGLGVYLFGFAAAVLGLAALALLSKPLIGVILGLAVVRSTLAGVYEVGGATAFDRVSGLIAAVIAGMAWYGGVALLLEEVRQRTVLPTFRRGAAADALEGGLHEQLERAKGDAGIRQQL